MKAALQPSTTPPAHVATAPPLPQLQRKCACDDTGEPCEDCATKSLDLRRRATDSATPGSVPPSVGDVLRSSGQPLDRATRHFMESRFAHDFSQVRVHTDSRAAESAAAVRALAYTVGDHVVVRPEHYAPSTDSGRRLLAHELAHVVQEQGMSSAPLSRLSELRVAPSTDPSEHEADAMAEQVMSQGAVDVPHVQPGGAELRRRVDDGLNPGGPLPYREATELAECIRIMGDPAYCRHEVLGDPLPASLTYSQLPGRAKRAVGGCGGYDWGIRWSLMNATNSTDGFVVQKVVFNDERTICSGGTNNFSKTYWEGWQVRNGSIFIGTSNSPHQSDTFTDGATPDQKGTNREYGYAKFMEGYTAPLTWGHVPEALGLPSTENPPAEWTDAGTLKRSVIVDFDCCGAHDPGTVTGEG